VLESGLETTDNQKDKVSSSVINSCSVITSPAGAVEKYRDEYVCHVCLSVCLSVREDISEPHAGSLPIFCACCLCPRLGPIVWYVADRPHRLSAGRDDGSAQRGRGVIYDYHVVASKQ